MARNESFFKRLTRLFRSGPSIQRRVKGQNVGSYYDTKLIQGNYGYRAPAPFGFGRENSPFSVLGSYGILDRMARYCITGDTLIATNTEIGSIRIDELAEKYKDPKHEKFYTFSYDHKTNKIVLRKIKNAFLTKEDYIVEVHFDNGAVLRCTADHRIMLRDGSYKEAQYLKPGTAIMPFYRTKLKKYKHNNNRYRVIYSPADGWKAEHKIVAEYTRGGKNILPEENLHVHHKNFNGLDNNISNLEIMDAKAHLLFHALDGKRASENKANYWRELLKITPSKASIRMKGSYKRKKKNPPIKYPKCSRPQYQNNNVDKSFTIENIIENWEPKITLSKLCQKCGVYQGKLLSRIRWSGYDGYTDFVRKKFDKKYLKNRPKPKFPDELPELQTIYSLYKKGMTQREMSLHFGYKSGYSILSVLRKNGYNTWKDFVETYKNNKVTKVVFTNKKEKVYDLTIEGTHNFAVLDPKTLQPCGIIHNSEFAEMEYCLHGETKIAVPGGYKTIKELANECEENKNHSFIIYSYDHNKKEIVPALGKMARLTRTDHAYKVTFSSGKEIIGTADHRLMKRDGSYCEIKNLNPGDAMMPFYRRSVASNREEGREGKYQTIYTVEKNTNSYGWVAEHKILSEFILGRKLKDDEVVHHKNFKPNDNRIENLEVMTAKKHRELHSIILNGKKWDYKTNSNWIDNFKKTHSEWMKKNNPAERKDITFEKILYWCDNNSYNLYKVCDKFNTGANTIKRKLKSKGFKDWVTFAKTYSPGWRSESWNNSGRKNPRFRADVTFGKICDKYHNGITKKQLAENLKVSSVLVSNRLKAEGYRTWTDFVNNYKNNKVVSVEYYGKIDLYDLTVDKYKNFATDSVISHNTPEIASAMDIYSDEIAGSDAHGHTLHIFSDNIQIKRALEELFYDVLNVEFNSRSWSRNLPVKWNSLIPLLDGNTITIKDLSKNLAKGEEIWVYSIQDKTKDIVPGKVIWCDKTYTTNKIAKVKLDNGCFIETSPEHTFVLRNGSVKRADELLSNDSLMPFYSRISSTENKYENKKDSLDGYEKVYNPKTNYFKYTHRVVAENIFTEEILNEKDNYKTHGITHHIDFNKLNNSPNNLKRMDSIDHFIYHSKHAKELLHNNPTIVKKRMAGIDKWLRSEKHKNFAREQLKILQDLGKMRTGWGEYNSSTKHEKDNKLRSQNKKLFWSNVNNAEKAKENMRFKLGKQCLGHIKCIFLQKDKYIGKGKLLNILKNDVRFVEEFKKINANSNRNILRALNGCTLNNMILRETGMVYCDFFASVVPTVVNQREYKIAYNGRKTKLENNKNKNIKNHKVESVEIIEETTDVFCMTVVGPNGEEDRHNFAVCAYNEDGTHNRDGVFVENCKYGDFFLYNEVLPDIGVINAQPIPVNELEREEGYDEEDPYAVRFKWLTRGNIYLENWQVTHMRILGNDLFLPYGTAILEPARRIWRQLIMMEDAMLVYRVVRSPERRVFYIDVGNIAPNDVPSYMEAAKSTLRSHSVIDRTTGRQDLRYNPLAVDEDYYIPVRGGQSGTKIDTLAGGTHVTATEDVSYIQSKLFAALKVPKPYLNYDENLCLMGNTQIPLLNGDTKTIKELSNMNNLENLWVYSTTNAGKIVPSKITKAWKTKEVIEHYKITLDNGEVVECTNNHPFMMRNGEYKRADKLEVGQSLMPIYRKISSKEKGQNLEGYEMVFDNEKQKWEYTHKVINNWEAKNNGGHNIGKARVVHHKDFNKTNNNPENLEEMTWYGHRKFHSDPELLKHTILRRDVIEKREIKRLEWLHSEEHRKISSEQMSFETNTVGRPLYEWIHSEENKLAVSRSMKNNWKNPEYRALKTKQNKEILQRPEVREKIFGENHWARKKTRKFNLEWLIKYCKEESIWEYKHFKTSKKSGAPVSSRVIQRIFKENEISGWRQFSKMFLTNNHKISKIEIIKHNTQIEVFDIRVEGPEDVHNFLIGPGVIVHNSSKATLAQEDIRFSRTIGNIQKIVIAELTKLAMIHLFAKGFDGEDLINFEIKLSNPSTVAVQQKLDLWNTKMDIAGTAKETGLVDAKWIQKNILELTEDDIAEISKGLYEDKITEIQLDKVAFEEEEESQSTTDAFSNSNYTMPGEDVPKSGPNSNGSTSAQKPHGGTDIIIPPGGKKKAGFKTDYKAGTSPIKASPFLTRNKKNKKRRVGTGGRANNANPDFAAMLRPGTNKSLSDVYDKGFLKNPMKREGLEMNVDGEIMTIGENELHEFKPEVSLPREMVSIISNLKEHLLIKSGMENKLLNEEILLDSVDMDEDEFLINEVLDNDTESFNEEKSLKSIIEDDEDKNEETIELNLE